MGTSAKATVVFILGMHRSGTSALSGAFNIFGANHGSSVMPPAEDNPKGYWEHTQIVEIHDQLFDGLSLSWDSTEPLPTNWLELAVSKDAKRKLISICEKDFSAPGLHCIKDPRMCRFLPLWGEICAELELSARFVFILRHPEEVAASLLERDGYSIERSLYLWALHIFDVVRFIADKPNHVLTYENLLENPAEEILSLIESLALDPPEKIDKAKLGQFVSRKLKHQNAHNNKPESPAVNAASTIYEMLAKNPQVVQGAELSAVEKVSLPLFQALNKQRSDLQGLLDGELDLADYIEKDNTILQSKLASNLQESKDYVSNLLRENEKLTNYLQSLKETIAEKDQFLASLQRNGEDLEKAIAEKGEFIESLQSHLAESQKHAGRLEENVARQNRESEEYSQSLLETIREKDSRFDEVTAQMIRVQGIIFDSLETLEGRKFIFPKTLGKIRSDLESLLSADDNEIEGE